MARNKNKKETCVEIEGQLSIWDIKNVKKPTLDTKTEVKITKIDVSFTEILNKVTPIESEKHIKSIELTDMQQEFINKNNIMKNDNLSRVIKYCGSGLGIELKVDDEFRTIYVNKEGKEEFKVNKKLPVLPMDKIVHYREELKATEIQEKNLKEILENKKTEVKRVIHRKGDENILIELKGRVVSLTPIGWKLDFNINSVDCNENEILSAELKEIDIKEMQQSIKVGDIVKAYYGEEVITGEICSAYGPDDITLNIIFDNRTKHTAICRNSVISLIKGRDICL